jgi:hypothetical protein
LLGANLAFQIKFTQELKEAILEVAEEVGEVEEIEILDKDGGAPCQLLHLLRLKPSPEAASFPRK